MQDVAKPANVRILYQAVVEEDERHARTCGSESKQSPADKCADASRLEQIERKVPDMSIPAVLDISEDAVDTQRKREELHHTLSAMTPTAGQTTFAYQSDGD